MKAQDVFLGQGRRVFLVAVPVEGLGLAGVAGPHRWKGRSSVPARHRWADLPSARVRAYPESLSAARRASRVADRSPVSRQQPCFGRLAACTRGTHQLKAMRRPQGPHQLFLGGREVNSWQVAQGVHRSESPPHAL